MNVFFDNCTPPPLAATLDGFIRSFSHHAFHIKDLSDLPSGRHAPDTEWIAYLQKHRDDWIFITGDGRVLRNSAERAALRSAGLHGFVLAPAFQRTPLHQQASLLLWKWPEIEDIIRLVAAPSMHEIPIGRGSKLRPLPL